MKESQNDSEQVQTVGLRAASAICRDRAISDVTLWRWRGRGWVKTVNIAGRCYVDLKSLAEFDRRAAIGEFALPPRGAAKKSAEMRAVNQEKPKNKGAKN